MLKDFQGHLQTDGYSVYDIFGQKEGVKRMSCMAHARRKFYEARDNDAERSAYVLEQMQRLYTIERKCREEQLESEEVLELR